MTTGFNPAFIVDNAKRTEFIAQDRACKALIKNMLQGRNIRKWVYNESDEYLLQTGYDTDVKCQFPAVYAHLRQWEDELEHRSDQGLNWWNLRACKYYSEFDRPEKIIWGLTADKWAFAYDGKQHYLPSNGYILTSDELSIKFLLGLLNSRLLHFYFGFVGVMTAGGAYTLKAATIEALPIPVATTLQQAEIVKLVDKVLAAKKRNPSADTSALEREIDKKVYRLYGLTDEEIRVIEGTNGEGDVGVRGGGHGVTALPNGRGAPTMPSGHGERATMPGDDSVRSASAPKKRRPKIEEEF